MKNIVTQYSALFITLLMCYSGSYAQVKNSEWEETEKSNCKRIKNLSVNIRQIIYPYSVSETIILVSYTGSDMLDFESQKVYVQSNLGKTVSTKWLPQFKATKKLSSSSVDSLTDIIYNYGYKALADRSLAVCYIPRHAILYVNRSQRLIGFIDICFQCCRYEGSSNDFTLGETCNQKFSMLQHIFKQNEIY